MLNVHTKFQLDIPNCTVYMLKLKKKFDGCGHYVEFHQNEVIMHIWNGVHELHVCVRL